MTAKPQSSSARVNPRLCYAPQLQATAYNNSETRAEPSFKVVEGLLANRALMILLVDDDDDVRETSADMLGELGYDVIQASNGLDALAILDETPSLQIMVTDIRMPGMSGLELCDLARTRRKNLKVILVSGYFIQQPIQRRFLQKPFRTHDLDQAIQAELGTN